METTRVKNTLKDKEVQLREGNAGVTRLVTTLKPGASKNMRTDPNATYREYTIITLPDNTQLPPLSSDDFADFKEINIVAQDDGKVDWKGTVPRRPANTAAVASSPVEAPVSIGFVQRMLNRVGL